ncbi:ABC transporter substrate-binding protein [Oryzibacter oryziterrae]|uniref:ABC transporter substrate-binding protein n=1 Tax=Oryzibacter oryziterrae TaxID=2766474 RepID=UPI001F453731|nr:ABC transporter substrate-binding protein [Oryzibacter oryziterrae]
MFKGCKSALMASAIGVSFLMTLPSAMAKEAIFALPAPEVGVPAYNPITGVNTNSANGLIYDKLIERAVDQTYHGHLAESWEEAPDGMSWTFHLRKGVKFHNGDAFNAQTIKDWIPLYKGTESEYMVASIASVEVVDDYTVKFVMKTPDPNLLYNFSSSFLSVVDPKVFKELGADYGVTEAVGTGPYKLESFTVGQETVLTRNDDYTWGTDLSANRGPAKIDKLTFREIPEDSTAFLELKTGGVDMLLSVSTDYLPEIKAQADLGLISRPGTDLSYFVMNVTKEPFTDIRVREAAAKAINQAEILSSIYGGVGSTADTFLISSLPESKVKPEYKIAYDPEKAGKLLDEAGWVKGADGIRVKDGKPLAIALWTQSDSAFRRLTEVVQAELKAVGFDATITTFDSSMIRDEYKKDVHQAAVRSYEWDNADIIDWFFGGDRLGYPNISMFNDPKAEALRAKAMTGSKNSEERTANFLAYHEYVLSQFPFSPIYQPLDLSAYNKTKLVLPDEKAVPYFSSLILDLDTKE